MPYSKQDGKVVVVVVVVVVGTEAQSPMDTFHNLELRIPFYLLFHCYFVSLDCFNLTWECLDCLVL